MTKIITQTDQETEAAGSGLAKALPDGAIVALYGELGAGKTAFVRGMAEGMGLSCRVSSPTFTIVNEYPGPRTLIHFDLYRLSGEDELLDIGWDDYTARGAVCAVEWSEVARGLFTGDEIVVRIEKISDSARQITIEGGPELC